ncbi:MAG: hypothetical protein IT428_12355 [Planctomycetaceae bacterium]|nr:hypothetical protein [Planctomycetaceae bacterium]
MGWHVHFGLPDELLGSSTEDEDSPVKPKNGASCLDRTAVAETRLELSLAAGLEFERLLSGPEPLAFQVSHGQKRPTVGSFLTTFVDSTTINVLVCVARC